MNDNILVIFNSLSNFVQELNSSFGTTQIPLQLYNRLLEKTTLSHKTVISKHVNLFRAFCIDNREGITKRDISIFKSYRIKYSEKVFVNIEKIYNIADDNEKNVIFKHLLIISAQSDPESKSKQILKQLKQDKGNTNSEENFISNMMDKVGSAVNPQSSNPMESIAGIMSSGIFQDLVSGMNNGLQSGDIDLGKLMATTNKMVNNLCEEISENDEDGMGEMGAMIGNMTGMLKNLQCKMNSAEVQERLPKQSQNQDTEKVTEKVTENETTQDSENEIENKISANTEKEIEKIKEQTVNSF